MQLDIVCKNKTSSGREELCTESLTVTVKEKVKEPPPTKPGAHRAAVLRDVIPPRCASWCDQLLSTVLDRREAADPEAASAARHGAEKAGGEDAQGRAKPPGQRGLRGGGGGGGGRHDRRVRGGRGRSVNRGFAQYQFIACNVLCRLALTSHLMSSNQNVDDLLGGAEAEDEEGSVAQSVRSASPAPLIRPSHTPDLVHTDSTLILFPANSCSRTGYPALPHKIYEQFISRETTRHSFAKLNCCEIIVQSCG